MQFNETNFFHHFTKPSPNYTIDEIKYILEYRQKEKEQKPEHFLVDVTGVKGVKDR